MLLVLRRPRTTAAVLTAGLALLVVFSVYGGTVGAAGSRTVVRAADTWAGRTPTADTWAGRTPTADTWAADTWAGRTPLADTWAADTWAGRLPLAEVAPWRLRLSVRRSASVSAPQRA